MEGKESYRSILKTTGIFGGVQIIQIVLNLIRGKFLAVFLGANGIGINGIFTTSIALINMVSSLGLNYSSVREISKAYDSNDDISLTNVITTFKHWL